MNSGKAFGATMAMTCCLLCSAGTGAEGSAEADFRALRAKVHSFLPHEPADVRERIADAASNIAECLPGTPEPPWGSRVGTAIEDVDYLYGNPPASPDGEAVCFYLVEPLHRALNVDEARDFSAALLMPDLAHSVMGKRNREAAEHRAREAALLGEQHFSELLRLVASGTMRMKDADALRELTLTIGDVANLQDCSAQSPVALQKRASEVSVSSSSRVVYNDNYQWNDLDAAGKRCIYMTWPLNRGLTAGEARDFLMALQLELGLSSRMSEELKGDE